MHDQRQSAGLADRLEIIDDVARTESEAQPVMRRHDVEGLCAGLFGPAGLFNRVAYSFADDGRYHRTLSFDRTRHDPRDLGTLPRGK